MGLTRRHLAWSLVLLGGGLVCAAAGMVAVPLGIGLAGIGLAVLGLFVIDIPARKP